jgi:heptaprenyl diphosphate synthase
VSVPSPAPGAGSLPAAPGGALEDLRASVGLQIADETLLRAIATGLADVEKLLREVVRSDVQAVNDAALHLVEAGGKRFRPLFTLLESVNARWDNTIAILTGDFLFAHASRLVADLGTDAARIIAETFGELVTGQMRETVGPGPGDDAVAHYLTVIAQKTGSLIATSGRFGGMMSGAAEEHIQALRRFGDIIGTAFQISDDIIDIASPSDELGKAQGTDLREGVRTLPMLYALADPDTDPRLTELLSGPIADDAVVQEALELLRASSGLERARVTLSDYAQRARAELAALPASPARDACESVADYLVARTH